MLSVRPVFSRVALCVLIAVTWGCAFAQPRREAPAGRPTAAARGAALAGRNGEPVTPDAAVATFDAVWTKIRDSHYDSTLKGVNWNGARAELRPRAERTGTVGELRTVIDTLLGRLGESHFVLIPQEVADGVTPDSALTGRRAARGEGTARRERTERRERTKPAGEAGDVGLSVRLVGDEVVVARLERGGAAAWAGVRIGWVVDSVAAVSPKAVRRAADTLKTPAARRAVATRLPYSVERLLQGPVGSRVRVVFRDGQDRRVALALERWPTPGKAVRFGNLPAMIARLQHERLPAPDGGCVGVIRFNVWMTPIMAAFDEAMEEVRACRGVVLDLRGNPGGVGGMVMGVGGHFLTAPTPLGTLHSRDGELRFVANPRVVNNKGQAVRPFAGPLAIVIDETSASTSEIFAAGMQSVRRARLFGVTSAGQALPAQLFRVPSGDVLMYVVADFTAPDGRRIEGQGAVPDETVPVTRADLLAGRDAPVLAALRWIDAERTAVMPTP